MTDVAEIEKQRRRSSLKEGRVFHTVSVLVLTVMTLLIAYPIWNVIVSSFSDAQALAEGNVTAWPHGFTLENYKAVFRDSSLCQAFGISVSKTLLGVATHLGITSMAAYAMSKRRLAGRRLYTAMGLVTMFFSGGMVPTYLLFRQLGLLDNFMVFILPQLFSYFDMVIIMNFFRDIPASLEESAEIDGASVWQTFTRIILPLSKPVLATIALFNGVFQWNDYMTAKMFINNKGLYPIQMKLYEIVVQSQMQDMVNPGIGVVLPTTTRSIQLATIVVTALPIVLVYPFLQKYFVSGMTLGAVKE